MKDQIKDIVSDAIQCHLQKSLKLIPDAEDEIIDLMAGVEDRIADEVEKLIKQAYKEE